MTNSFYTFIGCAHAIRHHASAADGADRQTALDTSSELTAVADQLLAACPHNATEQQVKDAFSLHVVTVLEAIETLRGTAVFAGLDDTLVDLLEHYYNAADSIMGGGGQGGSGGSSQGVF